MGKQHKKKLQKKLDKGGGTAEQVLAAHGPDAQCELQLLSQAPDVIHCNEVQNVLLWCLHPDLGTMPKWVMVRNRPMIRGALVVYVPGLDAAGLRSLKLNDTVQRLMRPPKSTTSRTAQTLATELLRVRLGRKRKAPGDTAAATSSGDAPTSLHPQQHSSGAWFASYVRQFALNPRERRENGYPAEPDAPSAPDGGTDPADAGHESGGEGGTQSGASAEAAEQGGPVAPGLGLLDPAAAGPSSAGAPSETRDASPAPGGAAPLRPTARLLAIDCEMCLAGEVKQVALYLHVYFVYVYVCVCVYLSMYPSFYLYLYLYICIHPFIYPSIHPSIYL